MLYGRAVLSTKCFTVWAKFVAIQMRCVDVPHLRLLKAVVKSLSYPFGLFFRGREL